MATTPVSRAFARRWVLLLVGVLVSVILAIGMLFVITPSYQAEARVLLLPPITAQDENPYLSLEGNSGFADVVAQRMTDAKTIAAIQAEGSNGNYSVARDLTTSAPILLIVGKGKTAAEALTTLHDVTAMVTPALADLQQAVNVPSKSLVSLNTVSSDVKASAVRKSQLRSVIGVGALGLAVTVLLVGLLDRLQRRKQAAEKPPIAAEAAAGARPKSVTANSGERRASESTAERRGTERRRNQPKRNQPRGSSPQRPDEGLGLLSDRSSDDERAPRLRASGESETAGNHGR